MVFYTFSLHKGCPRKIHLTRSGNETQHCLNATNGCRWVSPCSTQPTQNACKMLQMADVGFSLNLTELAGKQCNIADQKHRAQPSFLRL